MTSADEPAVRREVSTKALWCWALYDFANQPFPTVIQTFIFAVFFTRAVVGEGERATSLWGLAAGIAGLAVAISGPIVGAIVDRRGNRKPWLAAFTILCVVPTAALWFVKPDPSYTLLALVLVGMGTVASELAVIFYNAMLPSMVPPSRIGRWSGWGWGMGYAGGLACTAMALLIMSWGDSGSAAGDADPDATAIRLVWPAVALWYLIFALPLFIVTPDAQATGRSLKQSIREGWQQLVHSLRNIRQMPNIVRFLIAHMLYNDALATLFVVGGTYAEGTFDMDENDVALFGLALTATAGLGAVAFSWFDDYVGGKWTVVTSLVGLLVAAFAILLIESQLMFWVLGMVIGIFVGPAQAGSRSFLARVTPQPLQNQTFGLYALSGKATAFTGPLLVSFVTYQAASQRAGMSVIVVLLALGILIMLTVRRDTPETTVES